MFVHCLLEAPSGAVFGQKKSDFLTELQLDRDVGEQH